MQGVCGEKEHLRNLLGTVGRYVKNDVVILGKLLCIRKASPAFNLRMFSCSVITNGQLVKGSNVRLN